MVGSAQMDAAVNDRQAEHRHEVRTALFGIEASAHGLRACSAGMTSSQVDELALAMVDEVRRLRALLDERPPAPATFDLASAIAPPITLARAGGQRVETDVVEGIVVRGQAHAAAQVVAGLLHNAHRHAAGSRVQLRATVEHGVVTLRVSDRGPGIPRRLIGRLFEPGVRGPASPGTGMGLAIARRLMTEQGGSISAHRRRGGGTTFLLAFPSAGGA